jgi:hypothetical protein
MCKRGVLLIYITLFYWMCTEPQPVVCYICWILYQAGAAEEGYYVIANRSPTCEAGTATVVTSSNSTKFAVGGDGSVKVL